MPIFHAGFSIGTVVGALVAALCQATGVPVSWHVTAINVVVIGVGSYALRSVPHGEHEHREVSDTLTHAERRAFWTHPATLLIGLFALGMALAEGAANDWLALAMVDDHRTSKTVGTLIFAVFVTSMTAGRLLGVRVLARHGRVAVLRTSAAVAFIGLSVVIVGPFYLAPVGVVAWGLGTSLGFPVAMSAAADDARTGAARVSVVSTIGYLAFLAGPPVIGALGQVWSLLTALTVVLVMVLLSGLVAGAAREPSVRREVPHESCGEGA